MGDLIPFRTRDPEDQPVAQEPLCGHCAHFALSNTGIAWCLHWQESVDFGGECEEFSWPG